MRARILLLAFHLLLFAFRLCPAAAQLRMRDIYAEAPDSIFLLLTRNNRLDQIDFRENDMQAVVKNRFDAPSELLVLTDSYLQLRLSEHLTVEMRLLSDNVSRPDSLFSNPAFCMVETYLGPAPDSRIRFFDAAWHELPSVANVPSVDSFLDPDIDPDVRLALQSLPLIKASLSPDDESITFELQTSELTRQQREKADGKTHAIVKTLAQTLTSAAF